MKHEVRYDTKGKNYFSLTGSYDIKYIDYITIIPDLEYTEVPVMLFIATKDRSSPYVHLNKENSFTDKRDWQLQEGIIYTIYVFSKALSSQRSKGRLIIETKAESNESSVQTL